MLPMFDLSTCQWEVEEAGIQKVIHVAAVMQMRRARWFLMSLPMAGKGRMLEVARAEDGQLEVIIV